MSPKRWTVQDVTEALTVRRMIFDLIATEGGEWNEDLQATTYQVRDLFIIPGHDPDDEYPQRLGVIDCKDLEAVFLLQLNGDDTEHFLRCFMRADWERRLVP